MSEEAIPGGLNEDNLAALTTPTADTPMTDHAEQHSALTDLVKEASDEFVFQDMELTQLDAEVEDISDFLGGVDFTVNYGTGSWTYDSRSNPPNQGHFWSEKTGLSVRENEYIFSKESSGMVEVDWDKAIVGDTLTVTEIGNAEDFGIYLITEIVPDDSYYHYKVVMTSGNHALNGGQKYECSVTHKEKQFSSGFEHTHDLEEDAIAVNRRDIDDIVGYLDGTDSEMYLGSGTWIVDQVSSGPTPSDTQHLWMDDLDFNKVTKFVFARNPVGSADPSWDIIRPGDELYTQLDYAYTDNHGNFLVNYFEQQDIDGNPSENGQYYYFEVEPLEGKSTKGAAEAGQAVTGSITHYGLEFPDDSLSGEEIDLSHEHEEYLKTTGGEMSGEIYFPYTHRNSLNFKTYANGDPKNLSFTTGSYWEHVWKGDSHQKMVWNLQGNDAVTISGDGIDMHTNQIKGVKDPTSDSHAANKKYVDNAVSLGTAGISTASVGENALILTNKLNNIDDRLESLEFVQGGSLGTGDFVHGNYQEPGNARVYAAEGNGMGNFAINIHDSQGDTFIPPAAGDTFTYKINETEYSFEVDGVYPAGDTVAIQGPIEVASVDGDTIHVDVEMTGHPEVPEHDHEELEDKAKEHEDKIQDLESDVDKNAQDIKSLAASLADTLEIVTLVTNREWKYAGENKNPRTTEFSTDSWYFNKVTVIKIHKQDLGGTQHSWKDLVVGDEITIRYNEDESQPIDERYNGKFLVTSVVAKSGDTLTVGVAFVSGEGTIIDNKKYSVSIRGTRAIDMQAKLQEAMQASYGKKFKNDTGYIAYISEEINSGTFCWDGNRDTIYLSPTDSNGNQWHGSGKTIKDEGLKQVASVYEINNGKVKMVNKFFFTAIEQNSKHVKLEGIEKIVGGDLSNKGDYLINLGGWM